MVEIHTSLSEQLSSAWQESPQFQEFLENKDGWAEWISARNTYDDADLAIDAYLALHRRTEGEQYLHLYGVMQSLQLQNDSIEAIYRLVGGPLGVRPINVSRKTVGKKVNQLRFRLAGHPIKGERSNVLRGEMSEGRVVVHSCHLNTPHEPVDIVGLIDSHRSEHTRLLSSLLGRVLQRAE